MIEDAPSCLPEVYLAFASGLSIDCKIPLLRLNALVRTCSTSLSDNRYSMGVPPSFSGGYPHAAAAPPKPQAAPAPAPAAPEVTMDAATYYQQVSTDLTHG